MILLVLGIVLGLRLRCCGWVVGFVVGLTFYSVIWFSIIGWDAAGGFAVGGIATGLLRVLWLFTCVASALTILCLVNCCSVFVLLLLFVFGSDSWFTVYLVRLRVNSVVVFTFVLNICRFLFVWLYLLVGVFVIVVVWCGCGFGGFDCFREVWVVWFALMIAYVGLGFWFSCFGEFRFW